MRVNTRWLLLAVVVLAMFAPVAAWSYDPYLVVPPVEQVRRAPSYRYAAMTEQQALAELRRRGILFQRVHRKVGRVRTPIRLTGRLHGVYIHSSLPEEQRTETIFEICDARLALALDDFAAILQKHGIVEVVHYTMYRPEVGYGGGASVDSGAGGEAFAKKVKHRKGKRRGGRGKVRHTSRHKVNRGHRSQHPAGLAIDVGALKKKDGTWLRVSNDFHGTIGAQTCGAGAKPPKDPKGAELWQIVCETFDRKVFTYVLTPNFNLAHQDHFHMEIKPGMRWFLYH